MRPLVLALLSCLCILAACGRSEEAGRGQVVLYSSVDDYLLRQVMAAFEKETGITVKLVGDTEATKTTGLVERLLAESRRGGGARADVWWSSEPFGTIRLSQEGILEPYESSAAAAMTGGWPRELRGEKGDWYGFANRARVIVHHTERVPEDQAPRRLADLTDPRFRGRIGMARPQFGTTRGHMAFLLHECGEEEYRRWLAGLRANQVRIYDGNASVVRGMSQGEIDVGLTDTDDVWAGQRNQWPVGLVYEAVDDGRAEGRLCSPGSMLVPNTVALVKGGPNPEAGRRLIDFLLSARVERLMAESDSHNIPVHPELAEEFAEYAVPGGKMADLPKVAERIPDALRIWDEVVGK